MMADIEKVKKALQICVLNDWDHCHECPYWDEDCDDEFHKDILEVIEGLEERIAIMQEGGWRKVEDGLPDEYLDVWVYTTSMKVKSGSRVNSYWYLNGLISEIDDNYVTHWQYKHNPDPPKEGEQE